MSKYVSRTMDEVYDNFHNHFDGDVEEITWYLEELISKLQDELDYYQTFNSEENE
tara:strand:+ start:32 stop:196 length:165 start_codon:yes stop_codon:yes gene_type:complete